jgi:hypothetical protein
MGVRKILHIARTFLRGGQYGALAVAAVTGGGKQGIETQRQLPLIHKRQAVKPGFFDHTRANNRPEPPSRLPIERIELKNAFSIGIKSAN